MRLLPLDLMNRLLANNADRDADHVPVVKFFVPWGSATWIVKDMEQDGDTMFGLCDLGMGEPELGYVTLTELEAIKGPGGIAIERDLHWTPTQPLGEYAKDKAVDVALNAAGEGAGLAVAKGVGMAARPIKNMIAGKPVDDVAAKALAADFGEAGVEGTAGTITQNPATLRYEASATRANPQSRIAQKGDRTDDQISDYFFKTTNDLAANTDNTLRPATTQGVGETLIGKANDANAAVNAKRAALYQEVDQIVGPTPSAGNQNTSDLLVRLNSEKKALGASAKMNHGALLDEAAKQTKAVASDLNTMNFGQMQEMRSSIGKMAFDQSTDPYLASRYKDLYKAITDDMGATAKANGDAAYSKWKEADAFNASLYGPDSVKEAVKGLTKAADGEAGYKFITAKVNEGGTRLKNALTEIEKVGGTAQVDQFVATYVNRMGIKLDGDAAEVFSPRKFIGEWNKIAPEAKDQMFSGTRAKYRADLDRLARIVDARQAALKIKGRAIDNSTSLLVGWASGGTVPAFKMGKASYMDRLLTDPKVVEWMTKIPQAQMKKGGLADHISVLRSMSREALRYDTTNGAAFKSAVDQYLKDSGIEDD